MRWKALLCLSLVAGVTIATPSSARYPLEDDLFGIRPAVAVEGRAAVQPFAHALFCHTLPAECAPTAGPVAVKLTRASLAQLRRVNVAVNRSIRPVNDNPGTMGGDVWSLAPASGDCEDYAITKRHELIALGWPAGALRLALATTPAGEGHMVLLVRTSSGDLILDNRFADLRAAATSDLGFKLFQSATDPKRWARAEGFALVADGHDLVAANAS